MFRRIATAVAVSVVMTGLGATSASASTTLTVDEAHKALDTAYAASASAAKAGFTARGQEVLTNGRVDNYSGAVDLVHQRGSVLWNGNVHWVAQAGVGEFYLLTAADRKASQAELTLLGKPRAVALYSPVKLTANNIHNYVTSPDGDLRSTNLQTITAASKTSNGNGTSTYEIHATSTSDPSFSFVESFVISDSDNVLRSSVETVVSGKGNLRSWTSTYGYGPQTIAIPAVANTVTFQQYNDARYAIAHFSTLVKARANEVAKVAKALAGKAHRTKVTVADVRKAASLVAAAHKKDVLKVSTTAVPGGVKLRAVNPATRKAVAFTVKATSGKAVVKKA